MKKLITLAMALILFVSLVSVASADRGGKTSDTCTTIQSGSLLAADGSLITTGYDQWGYNYQARMFNGDYCDFDRAPGLCQDAGVKLMMKWNDAWLSNKDCDGDGLLDRHRGLDSYIGSGAWLTNHMSGGEGADHWTYFVKIIAAPANAHTENGLWYTADGTEIGSVIWGEFAIIQEVESGSGATYKSPARAGLGNW
jgi:hypothetical protein